MEREDLGCYLGRFLHRRFIKAIREAYKMNEIGKGFSDYKPWNFQLLREFVQNKDSEQIRQAISDLSVYNIFFLMFEKEMADMQFIISNYQISDRFLCSLCKEVLFLHNKGEF